MARYKAGREIPREVLERVTRGRRAFIKRVVGGTFALPVLTSFSLDLLRLPQIVSAEPYPYPYPYPCSPSPEVKKHKCVNPRGPSSVHSGFEARIKKNGKIERGDAFHVGKQQDLTLVTIWDADVVGTEPVAQHADVFLPDGSLLYPGPADVSLSPADIDQRRPDRLNPVSVLLSGIGPGSPVGRWYVHVSLITPGGVTLERCDHFELHC